jgi:hypothetical protein
MTACKGCQTFHTHVVVLQEAGGGGPSEGLRSFHQTSNSALYLLRFEHSENQTSCFSEHTPTGPDSPTARGVAMLWR